MNDNKCYERKTFNFYTTFDTGAIHKCYILPSAADEDSAEILYVDAKHFTQYTRNLLLELSEIIYSFHKDLINNKDMYTWQLETKINLMERCLYAMYNDAAHNRAVSLLRNRYSHYQVIARWWRRACVELALRSDALMLDK